MRLAAAARCRCARDRGVRQSRRRARSAWLGDHAASRRHRGDLRCGPGRSYLPCRTGRPRVPPPPARSCRATCPPGTYRFDLHRADQYRRPLLRPAQARQLRAHRRDNCGFPQVPAGTGLGQARGGGPCQYHLRYRHSPATASCHQSRVICGPSQPTVEAAPQANAAAPPSPPPVQPTTRAAPAADPAAPGGAAASSHRAAAMPTDTIVPRGPPDDRPRAASPR
jgi:hypothetical protein